jgi:hypothetical protein
MGWTHNRIGFASWYNQHALMYCKYFLKVMNIYTVIMTMMMMMMMMMIIIFIINNNSIRNDNEGVIIMISFNSITAAIATTKADK